MSDTHAGGRRFDLPPLVGLLVCLAIVYGAAAIGSAFTFPQLAGWYAGLTKPWFNPPNAVFGPVWGVLYTMMAVAAWRVWRAGRRTGAATGNALTLFGVQLILNVAWSVAFFGLRNPEAAVVVIAAMLAAILATILAFRRIDGWAAVLMLPYLAWVSFATLLNIAVARLN